MGADTKLFVPSSFTPKMQRHRKLSLDYILENPNKKKKFEQPILLLSHDETMQIMSFMTVGETMMLALSNKTLYDTITTVLKNLYPFTTQEPTWSIVNAYLAALEAHERRFENTIVNVQAITIDTSEDLGRNEEFIQHEKYETEIPILREFNEKKIQLEEISAQGLLAHLSGAVFVEELVVHVLEDNYKDLKKKLNWPKKIEYLHDHDELKVIPVQQPSYIKGIVDWAAQHFATPGIVYYQLTEPENVSSRQKIIVVDKANQTLLRDDDALKTIGVIKQNAFTLCPLLNYQIFVQNKYLDRLIPAGSSILYETSNMNAPKEEEDKCVTVPVLEHLKSINIECNSDEPSAKSILSQVLQVAPNLKSLNYVYIYSPEDDLLEILAEYNPKLVYLFVKGNDNRTPGATYFTDEGMLEFLSKVNLEQLHLENNDGITGSLFNDIGKVATNLKVLSINRVAYEDATYDEAEEIYFGGGVMSKLVDFSLEGTWANLDDKFGKTLAQCAPNIRNLRINIRPIFDKVSISVYTKMIEGLDLYKLTVDLDKRGIHVSEEEKLDFIKVISAKKNLATLCITTPGSNVPFFSREELKTFTMPALRKFTAKLDTSEEWMTAFRDTFPNLEKSNVSEPLSEEEQYFQKWIRSRKSIIIPL
jgi:hypothetical protein